MRINRSIRWIACFTLSTVLLAVMPIFTSAETYWAALAAYTEAVENGDDDGVIDAVRRIEAAYPAPDDAESAMRIMFPSMKVASIYESRGQFDLAAKYYARFLEMNEITKDEGYDFSDYEKALTALYRHNGFSPTVYAETGDVNNIPYYSARSESRAGVSHGMCMTYDPELSNAYLLYATYFSEDIEDFSWQLPTDTEDFLLVAAWNVPNEDLEDLNRIVSGDSDEYMRRNLEYLSTLNCRVLLRFGAEINTWSALPKNKNDYDLRAEVFTETYKQAFRRVAEAAHTYAPNVGMVYSPNDISNWYFSPEDFYPGDEYVDWVGMSSYMNKASDASGNLSNSNDAYYSRGYYEDQIIKIQGLVDAFGDRKPIIITEGGYRYENASGADSAEHAADMMRYFYTYVTRVYPQIKSVMYFNANFGRNKYLLFGEGANNELGALYKSLVGGDVAMEYSMGRSDKCGYAEITQIDEITDSLNLSVFAAYPSDEPITVEYRLDGEVTLSTQEFPYDCRYATEELGVGVHRLRVTVSCQNTVTRLYYSINVSRDGRVSVDEDLPLRFDDVADDFWGYDAIAYGVENGLFNGMSETTFEPNKNLTRAMFVTILGRLSGVDMEEYDTQVFDDTPAGMWYSPYVAWAKEFGIVNGTSETTFEPDVPITREQMCTILVRYAEYKGITALRIGSDDRFADDETISEYAWESVYKARNAGLVNGKGEGNFEPDSHASRAEAATIMMRFMKRFV